MEVSYFVLLYFGTRIFVRCSEVSVVQRCPLMEVPLYWWRVKPETYGNSSSRLYSLFSEIMYSLVITAARTNKHFISDIICWKVGVRQTSTNYAKICCVITLNMKQNSKDVRLPKITAEHERQDTQCVAVWNLNQKRATLIYWILCFNLFLLGIQPPFTIS